MLPKLNYVRAKSTEEAINHLSSGNARIHAGGTDLLGCLHDGIFESGKMFALVNSQGVIFLKAVDANRQTNSICLTEKNGLRIRA